MSRNFSLPRTGNFCVQIDTFGNGGINSDFELLKLSENQVVPREPLLQGNQIEFNDLQAGNYQLTLRNIAMEIVSAELCPGMMQFPLKLVFMTKK
jgi:hypothetical protein